MNANTITFGEMCELVASSEDYDVSVVGAEANWYVFIHAFAEVRALSRASEGPPAVFRTLSQVEIELRELGVLQFDVAGSDSDRAVDFPATAADREYDAWFRAQVQEALDDPGPDIPHDEAIRQIRAALKLS